MRRAAICAALLCTATLAQAQIGTGWTSYSPTMRIHLDDENGLQTFTWTSSKSVGSGSPCADYQYNSTTKTHRFRILDNRSNRSEIRLQNEYRTGQRQFQGYVKFSSPLNDESLFQIFGNSGDAATFCMVRGYSANNGEIRVMSPAAVIASNVYGKEVRINMVHVQNQNAKFYVNGTLKHTKTDSDTAADNYHKFGCYGTLRTSAVTVYWRDVRHWRK